VRSWTAANVLHAEGRRATVIGPEAREVDELEPSLVEVASAETGSRSSGRSLLKRMAVYAPSSLVPSALSLATSIIFTRIFSPVDFGKYSLFLVYAAPIELLFTVWLIMGTGKFLSPEKTPEGRQRLKQAIFLATALIFLSEIVLATGGFFAGNFLLSPEWRPFLLPTFLYVIACSLFDVMTMVFPAEARAKQYTSFILIDSVATFALRLLLVSAIFSMNIRLMFWSVVLSHCFVLPFIWRRAGFPAPHRLFSVLRSSEIRGAAFAFLTFGLPMTVWFSSSVVLDVGDRYVLNFLMGPAVVGIYDTNYRLIAALAPLMAVPITVTLHPHLMAIGASGDTARIKQVIGEVIENLLLVGVLTVGLTFLFHRDVARILLGAEFRPGSVVMPAVVAGVILFNVGTFAHKPFEIVGRTRVMMVFAVIAAAANVGFCFALIPIMGYVGAAYATLLSYALYTVCVGYLGRRIFRWRVNLRRLITQGGIIVACVAAIDALRHATSGMGYGWSLAVAVVASCALASVSLLALLRRLLTSTRPEGHAELRSPARPFPQDFLRVRMAGRHRQHPSWSGGRFESPITETGTAAAPRRPYGQTISATGAPGSRTLTYDETTAALMTDRGLALLIAMAAAQRESSARPARPAAEP
jgi:O-antigen/teichoic acid export membrane protein